MHEGTKVTVATAPKGELANLCTNARVNRPVLVTRGATRESALRSVDAAVVTDVMDRAKPRFVMRTSVDGVIGHHELDGVMGHYAVKSDGGTRTRRDRPE